MNADSSFQLQAAGTLSVTVNVVDKSITRYLKSRDLSTGCTSSRYLPVQAILDKTPIPKLAGADAFCRGDSVLLRADSAATYTWWLNNQVLIGKSGQSVFLNSPGIYQVSLLTANGCIRMSAIKSIVQLELPKVNLDTAAGTIICDTTSLFLRASGGFAYQWNLDGVRMVGDSSAAKRVSEPGIYQVKAIDANGCISLPSPAVNIRQQLRLKHDITLDTTCVGIPVRMTANSAGTALTPLIYQWQVNGVTYTGKSIGPVFNLPGNVSLRLLANTVSCPTLVDTLQKAVTVQSSIPGIRYEPLNATVNKLVQLEARSGALNYRWTPGTGLDNSLIRSPKAKLTNELTYNIQLTTTGKCLTVDTLLVRVFKQVDILVPKAFTPNFDGKNDYLYPILVGLERLIQFSVFDRWGNLVYLQKDISNKGWDGTYKGRPAPSGIYVWMAEAAASDGATVRRNGNTMLIR
jgi:gliding motility-associated-like protein